MVCVISGKTIERRYVEPTTRRVDLIPSGRVATPERSTASDVFQQVPKEKGTFRGWVGNSTPVDFLGAT